MEFYSINGFSHNKSQNCKDCKLFITFLAFFSPFLSTKPILQLIASVIRENIFPFFYELFPRKKKITTTRVKLLILLDNEKSFAFFLFRLAFYLIMLLRRKLSFHQHLCISQFHPHTLICADQGNNANAKRNNIIFL